jgi:hypothetical protein
MKVHKGIHELSPLLETVTVAQGYSWHWVLQSRRDLTEILISDAELSDVLGQG